MPAHGDLMAAAVAETGLDDFGDDSFREGLEILVRALARRGAPERGGRGVPVPAARGPPRPAPPGRGLVPAASRDRRGADRGAAVRPRPAPHRLDRAVVPARPGPGHPLPAPVGVLAAVPAAVDRGRPRPAHPAGGGRDGGHPRPRPHRRRGADGVPGPHGARLQDAHLPGVRPDPVVLGLAARRRPHLHLPLRAPGAEAAPVGRAGAAVAAEVAGPRAVPPLPRPRLPRRPLRDDPPRPHRRDPVGGRGVRRHRRRASPTTSTSATWAS